MQSCFTRYYILYCIADEFLTLYKQWAFSYFTNVGKVYGIFITSKLAGLAWMSSFILTRTFRPRSHITRYTTLYHVLYMVQNDTLHGTPRYFTWYKTIHHMVHHDTPHGITRYTTWRYTIHRMVQHDTQHGTI